MQPEPTQREGKRLSRVQTDANYDLQYLDPDADSGSDAPNGSGSPLGSAGADQNNSSILRDQGPQ